MLSGKCLHVIASLSVQYMGRYTGTLSLGFFLFSEMLYIFSTVRPTTVMEIWQR